MLCFSEGDIHVGKEVVKSCAVIVGCVDAIAFVAQGLFHLQAIEGERYEYSQELHCPFTARTFFLSSMTLHVEVLIGASACTLTVT